MHNIKYKRAAKKGERIAMRDVRGFCSCLTK